MKENKKILEVTLIVLLSINFWSFRPIPTEIYKLFEIVLIVYLLSQMFINRINLKNANFKKYVFFLILVVLFSSIPALIIHKQPISLTIQTSRFVLLWLFYFRLHQIKIKAQSLQKIIFWIGVVWTFLLVIQQLTYPRIWFYTRMDAINSAVEIRYGIYRLMTYRHHFAMLAFFFTVSSLIAKQEWRKFFYAGLFLTGMYFYVTRQFLFGTLIGALILPFYMRHFRFIIIGTFFGLLLLSGIIYYSDLLFNSYIDSTIDQLSKDNVRYISFKYFTEKFNSGGLFTYFFGNGLAHDSTNYGRFINGLKSMGLYQSDIGIVGSFSKFGIIYVIIALLIQFKVVFSNLLTSGAYLRVFFIINISLLITSDYFMESSAIPFYCIALYLYDWEYHLKKN